MSQQTNTGDPGSEGSAVASRQIESPGGGDVVGSLAESSKVPAQSARKTDENSSSASDGSAGSRSASSIIMAQAISLDLVV